MPQIPEEEKWLAAPPLQKERLPWFETLAARPPGIQVWQPVSDQFGTYPGWILSKEQKETSPALEVAGFSSVAFLDLPHKGKRTPAFLLPVPPSWNHSRKLLYSQPCGLPVVGMQWPGLRAHLSEKL